MDKEPQIKIPPGYTKIPPEQVKKISSVVAENIRILNGRVAYVFNPQDPEYLRFAEQCKEDSKALARALHEEFKRQDCPVWTKPSRPPPTGYRKMSFLIRPPFFSSKENDKAHKRVQKSDDRDMFVMHFDQDHTLQDVRFWFPSKAKYPKDITTFRSNLSGFLGQEGDFFKANYGNWEVIAKRIVTITKILLVSLEPRFMPNRTY